MNESMLIFKCKKCDNMIIAFDWFPIDGLYCQCAINGVMSRNNWVRILPGDFHE